MKLYCFYLQKDVVRFILKEVSRLKSSFDLCKKSFNIFSQIEKNRLNINYLQFFTQWKKNYLQFFLLLNVHHHFIIDLKNEYYYFMHQLYRFIKYLQMCVIFFNSPYIWF